MTANSHFIKIEKYKMSDLEETQQAKKTTQHASLTNKTIEEKNKQVKKVYIKQKEGTNRQSHIPHSLT